MLLSIVINAWPGTDKFRFRLQLETLMHDTIDKNNYLLICKVLLNGWERNTFKIPDDNFKTVLERYHFQRVTYDVNDENGPLTTPIKSKPALQKADIE